MPPNLTDTLCTRCGLCCDGSLFADVELANRAEADGLEAMGLEIEEADGDESGLLVQPCRALTGKRCRIYAHRPKCCRTFECQLLRDVRRGATQIEQAKEVIKKTLWTRRRLEESIIKVGRVSKKQTLKERCEEALALSPETAGASDINQQRAELATLFTAMERLIKKSFLGR